MIFGYAAAVTAEQMWDMYCKIFPEAMAKVGNMIDHSPEPKKIFMFFFEKFFKNNSFGDWKIDIRINSNRYFEINITKGYKDVPPHWFEDICQFTLECDNEDVLKQWREK